MRVIFIGSTHISVEKYLTKYKWYETGLDSDSEAKYYLIDNDYGQKRRYKAQYFMTLAQLRDKKITDLGI
jgi:hypothetical protein